MKVYGRRNTLHKEWEQFKKHWLLIRNDELGLPGGTVVKNPLANAPTRVQPLVWEDPRCCGASPCTTTTEPMSHNYWSLHVLGPVCRNYWAHVLQLRKPVCSRARVLQLLSPRASTTEAHMPRACAPQQEKTLQWEARVPQWRVAPTHSNEDPTQQKQKTKTEMMNSRLQYIKVLKKG